MSLHTVLILKKIDYFCNQLGLIHGIVTIHNQQEGIYSGMKNRKIKPQDKCSVWEDSE